MKNILRVALLTLLAFGCRREDPVKRYAELMQKATAFQQEGKWEEARLSLLSATEARPDSLDAYFQLGETLVRLKRFNQALEQYQTVLNLDPAHRDARIRIASLYLAASQTEQAESHVQKLLESAPDDAEVLILRAALEKSRKDYTTARKTLTGVLEHSPDNAAALASLGDLALNEGKLAEAEELFLQALKQQPSNSALRLAIADLLIRQGRTDEAEALLHELVEEEPKNAGLRFYYGEFLLLKGLNDKATEQYTQMLALDPQRHDARDRLYDMYVIKRDREAAFRLTAELKEKEPKSSGLLYFHGRDAELQRQLPEALASYLKALQVLPGFAPAFRRAGLIEMQLGKTAEGVQHLTQAVTLNPVDVGARLALAKYFFLTRDFAQAKDHIGRVLQAFPRQLGANLMKADIALIEGDLRTAEVVYQALIKSLPNNPLGYFKMGMLEERRNNAPAAIEYYRKGFAFDREVLLPARRFGQLVALNHGISKAVEELSRLHESSKNSRAEYGVILGSFLVAKPKPSSEELEQARRLFEEALNLKPDLLPAYYALAQLEQRGGDFAAAEANYRKLAEKQPKHVPTRMLLAMALERQANFEGAAQEYREILKLSPRFAPAANNLAWLLVNNLHGDLDAALQLALIAKEEMPAVGQVADTLGWIYFQRGSSKAALPILEEALESARKDNLARGANPEILYHLGAVRADLGMKEEARAALEEALAAGGDKAPFAAAAREILDRLN